MKVDKIGIHPIVLAGVFLLIVLNGAHAGVVNGGGGKGVLCQSGTQSTLELLDLYEARNVFRWPAAPSGATFQEQLEQTLERYAAIHSRSDAEDLRYFLTALHDEMVLLPQGVRVKSSDDSLETIVPETCKIVQVAFYQEDQRLLIDSEYWNLLTPQGQVALLLHEYFYYRARKAGYSDSRFTRQTVGFLVSGAHANPVLDGVPGTGVKICWATGGYPSIEFLAWSSCSLGIPDCGVEVRFLTIGGMPVVTRTTGLGWAGKVEFLDSNTPGITGLAGPVISEMLNHKAFFRTENCCRGGNGCTREILLDGVLGIDSKPQPMECIDQR